MACPPVWRYHHHVAGVELVEQPAKLRALGLVAATCPASLWLPVDTRA